MKGLSRLGGMRSYRGLMVAVTVVLGVAAIAIAIGAIWLNSFIHSPGFKDEIESRASQSLGGPVQIDAVDFDVLHGIKLRGFATQIDPGHDGGQGVVKINVAQVNCAYSLGDLLAGKLRLTGVTLEQPQFTLTKQPAAPPQSSAASEISSTPGGATPSSSNAGGGMPFQFVLDRVKVSAGSVTVLDASGATMVDLQGVNADADTSGYSEGKDVTGTIRVAQVTASNMQATNFSSPVAYHTNFFSALPLDATAYNGRLAGDFQMRDSGPSVLNLNGNGVDVEQLLAASSPGSTVHLTGSLEFVSKWRNVESGILDGEGDAQLTNGKIENMKILREISSLLRVKELNDPIITKATTHFVARRRLIVFNGLQLNSPLFSMTGNGAVGLKGELGADLVLILSRDAMAKLPSELAASLVQQPDGTGSIAFHVSGTTSSPHTNLAQRLLLQNTDIKSDLNKELNNYLQ